MIGLVLSRPWGGHPSRKEMSLMVLAARPLLVSTGAGRRGPDSRGIAPDSSKGSCQCSLA